MTDTKHNDENCQVPFCKVCLENIKHIKKAADDLRVTDTNPEPREQLTIKWNEKRQG